MALEMVLCRGSLINALLVAGRLDEAALELAGQERVAAASGDVHFKAEVIYQRLGLALGRGDAIAATQFADALKGTPFERQGAEALARGNTAPVNTAHD
jgi:hypothetical protein